MFGGEGIACEGQKQFGEAEGWQLQLFLGRCAGVANDVLVRSAKTKRQPFYVPRYMVPVGILTC